MAICKKIFLILGVLIYIAIGMILRVCLLFINPARRFRIISLWTRTFNRFLRLVLRIKVIVEGDRSYLNEKGNFIISNHLGYLDGVVLGSLFPVVYISKSQVKTWPLFGWMTQVAGTIFIDRKRKFTSVDYIRETSQMLKRRVNVLVFPEGTSTDGERLLPFQSIHFQAPLDAKGSILPVAISYTKINNEEVNQSNRDKLFWYGQTGFYKHLFSLLELSSIQARVVIYPKMELDKFPSLGYYRKELSQTLYKIISGNYPLFKTPN